MKRRLSVKQTPSCLSGVETHYARCTHHQEVDEIVVSDETSVSGVKLRNGSFIEADCVLSNATIHKTSHEMLRNCAAYQSSEYAKQVASYDYTSPVTKINGG